MASADALVGNHHFDILLFTSRRLFFLPNSLFAQIDDTLSLDFQNTGNELCLITQILCLTKE